MSTVRLDCIIEYLVVTIQVLVEPIFEKCYLREKGGVLTEIWQSRNMSSRAVPVEYQVEPFFINFSMSSATKGCRQGPASGNSMYTGIPIVHEGRYRYLFTEEKSCNR